jgi:hypothetical protein
MSRGIGEGGTTRNRRVYCRAAARTTLLVERRPKYVMGKDDTAAVDSGTFSLSI